MQVGDKVKVRSIPQHEGVVVEFRSKNPCVRVQWHRDFWTWEDFDALIVIEADTKE